MSSGAQCYEFFVEEPSAEQALRILLPKMLPQGCWFNIYVFSGKRDLIAKLPARLDGYSKWIPPNYRIIVLVDRDSDDCVQLKAQLETIARKAGLITKSATAGSAFQVANRIVCEELEAWFLGDTTALSKAYPKLSKSFSKNVRYSDPDNISGGTWESLEKLLQRHHYFSGGLEKIRAAKEIAAHMDPTVNRSKSFQTFRAAL